MVARFRHEMDSRRGREEETGMGGGYCEHRGRMRELDRRTGGRGGRELER